MASSDKDENKHNTKPAKVRKKKTVGGTVKILPPDPSTSAFFNDPWLLNGKGDSQRKGDDPQRNFEESKEERELLHFKLKRKLKWRNPYALCTPIVTHTLHCISVIVFFSSQSISLNYYVHSHFHIIEVLIILITCDIICIGVFMYALQCAYLYMKGYAAEESLRENVSEPSNKKYNVVSFQNSVMPFIYISWMTYIFVLSIKITIIYKSSITDILLQTNVFFGPQTLKITIGLTSLVFLFLAEGHNWVSMEHPRNRYVKTLCAQTVVDIFDTVSLLSIIMDGPQKEQPLLIENSIIFLASFNLLLPALKLFKLSLAEMSPTKADLIIVIVHSLSYVLIINCSFLAIRLHIWVYDGEDPSIYLMKNIISIIISLWQIYPAFVLLKNKRFDLYAV